MSAFNQSSLETKAIALLAGGNSDERDVSLESGAAVAAALRGRGHEVTCIDPADVELPHVCWSSFDVAFLALHGRMGEDGYVQEILENAGLRYTGSDPVASRLAFSKSASKERFAQSGVPTPAYVLIHESDEHSRIHRHAETLGYPLVVKPDTQGSSLGVTIVKSPDQLSEALSFCFGFDAFGILETAVVGTEWTLGLLDERMLPLIQITSTHQFFDYQAKYEDDSTGYQFEFSIPADVVKSIESAGRGAAQSVGTRGLVRVDLRLDESLCPWVLEVNTIPGFTSHSLVPKAAARMGISFGALCERAIAAALNPGPALSPSFPPPPHKLPRRIIRPSSP